MKNDYILNSYEKERLVFARFQPLQIISYIFIFHNLGIVSVSSELANFIFQLPFIGILALGNFTFLLIVEFGNRSFNEKNFWFLFMSFLGGFGIMLVGWTVDTISIPLVESEFDISESDFWLNIAMIYSIGGGFLYEIYFLIQHRIVSLLSSSLTRKSFEFLS